MYHNLLASSVSSLRSNTDSIFSFTARTHSCSCLYREFFFFTPLLMSYLTHTLWNFFCWPLLDTFFLDAWMRFFSRRLVADSGSKAERFRRVLELTQEPFRPRPCIRNLPLFFFGFYSKLFQALFHFRSHSRSRVLTVDVQFKDVACRDTVYIVDPFPHHAVCVVPSTNSVMIHPVFDSRRRSFFVGFSALWAPPKPMTTLAVKTDPIVE